LVNAILDARKGKVTINLDEDNHTYTVFPLLELSHLYLFMMKR
jgi:hypothetical protein